MVMPFPPSPMMPPQPAAMALPQPPMPNPLGMMGMPPSPGMMGAGIDPSAMLANPQILELIIQLMMEQEQEQNGPVYDWWYKPGDYPKLNADQVTEKAKRDHDLHSLLINRIRADRQILMLLDSGRFHDFDPDVEHTFQDSALAHDFMLQVNLVAGCDINYNAIARTKQEEDLAEKKETLAHSIREHNKRRHGKMYGTVLAYDEAKYLAGTGHLVGRVMYDLNARSDECPIKIDLLDPSTCFPTWDGDRGLLTMTRVYSESVDRVISTWETKRNKVRTKVLGQEISDPDGNRRLRTLNDQIEIHEYWDRRHNIVTAAGVEIFHWEHKLGGVPFVYVRSPFGDAGPTSLQALDGTVTLGAPSEKLKKEIAMKGLSVIWATKTTHTQREALLALMMTEAAKVRNPPRTFEQDLMVYGDKPQVADAPGSVSLLRKGLENETAGPQKPGMSLIPGLMSAANEANQRGMMPASAYGLSANANESGTAYEGMNESGRDKITPLLEALTDYHIQCAEWGLRLVRDWGHLMGTDGERGTLYIPRRKPNPDKDGYLTIEPKELRQVGIQIKARMTSIRLANLGNFANALGMLKNNGWIEDVTAMELLGLVDDPVASLKRIKVEKIQNSEEYVKWESVKLLKDAGDYQGADFIASLMQQQPTEIPVNSMPGMPPGMPGGPGTMGGNTPGMPQGPQGATQLPGGLGMPNAVRLPGPPPDLAARPGPGQVP